MKPLRDLPRFKTNWLTVEDFEFLCFDFTREFLSFDEPIPDYSTRDLALLESSLGSPRQTFGGKYLYPTLEKQAAILFYSLIKNHPFKNGNKRIAVMSLLAFLAINNKWINISPGGLYKLAYSISGTPRPGKDKVLEAIEGMLTDTMISFSNISKITKDVK